MDALRIQNLRSLADTGFISIKPLTFLLGQNSSGKSTFLRCFPLIRQSVDFDTKTRSPIAWNGRFVDYGSFNDAVRTQADPHEICFHFRFRIDTARYLRRRSFYLHDYYSHRLPEQEMLAMEVKVGIQQVSDTPMSSLSTLEIKVANEHRIAFHLPSPTETENDSVGPIVEINDREFSSADSNLSIASIDQLIPVLVQTENRKISSAPAQQIWYMGLSGEMFQKLMDLMRQIGGSISEERVLDIIASLPVSSSKQILNGLITHRRATTAWQRKAHQLTIQDERFKEFKDFLLLTNLSVFTDAAGDYISGTFDQCRYIGPVRATAERHYRIQDFIVDEIDSLGRNMAAFLSALQDNEMLEFQQWTAENFGFIPSVASTGSHLMLQIRNVSDFAPSNLADMGFGFSQVLPIITQLWALLHHKVERKRNRYSGRYPNNSMITFCIEQPELHLHPRLQSQLLEVFAKTVSIARKKNIDLRLVMETHSETMINTLGRMISRHDVSADDINVVLFDRPDTQNDTQVKISGYDADGFLKNWPMGFFDGDGFI